MLHDWEIVSRNGEQLCNQSARMQVLEEAMTSRIYCFARKLQKKKAQENMGYLRKTTGGLHIIYRGYFESFFVFTLYFVSLV